MGRTFMNGTSGELCVVYILYRFEYAIAVYGLVWCVCAVIHSRSMDQDEFVWQYRSVVSRGATIFA